MFGRFYQVSSLEYNHNSWPAADLPASMVVFERELLALDDEQHRLGCSRSILGVRPSVVCALSHTASARGRICPDNPQGKRFRVCRWMNFQEWGGALVHPAATAWSASGAWQTLRAGRRMWESAANPGEEGPGELLPPRPLGSLKMSASFQIESADFHLTLQ